MSFLPLVSADVELIQQAKRVLFETLSAVNMNTTNLLFSHPLDGPSVVRFITMMEATVCGREGLHSRSATLCLYNGLLFANGRRSKMQFCLSS
jgi:hypothetical protein